MAPMMSASPRVLSIQSHVVSGYCGNKSATFPLQLLEFEVDVINTVQLSNHTQYKVALGQIFSSKDLKEIHSGLKANNLLTLYDHILSGYVSDISYIEAMAEVIKDIKAERSGKGLDCWYTFDPVLGDDGLGYYVPDGPKVAEAYKKNLLPLADIITPNRFEASILSGVQIDCASDEALSQVIQAINVFHKQGVRIVIITSFALVDSKQLICIVSSNPTVTRDSTKAGHQVQSEAWMVRIPKLDCQFTGTGDLFAALMTGWLKKTNFDIKKSFENTANSIHEILEDTFAWRQNNDDGTARSYELRLVQNKMKILNPSERFKADRIAIECLSDY